ncbi:MAG: dihydrodipicolinate reductase [Deltaproteobacteria bacterium]|nr:dihydrodipicolinate reductase [Deltaproteobacteria bacterium]MBW2697395.1 dihydrodipicolinate reductase [Deltaproteobacteria bacterium]
MGHRVIQWGTGNVGFHSLHHIIRHPDLELVGVHAHSPEKIGQDAGSLCGLAPETGIVATNDIDALLTLDADVVVYTVKGETRPHEVVPELERILASGKNVVSTSMIFLIYPQHADASMREPLEKACQAGRVSLYVNGIDPGFSGDVLPLAALQLADQIDEIRVQELCDYSTYEDPEFTGVSFGFGRPADYTPPMARAGVLRAGWGGMVQLVADQLGVELDEIRESYDRRYAEAAFDTPMMHVAKGTCAAVRFVLEGMAHGRPVVVTEHVNRLRQDIAPDWPMPPDGRPGVHRCIVKGNPSVALECFVEGADGDHNTGGVQATALRVINAIQAVCDCAPGLVSTLDLPYTPSRNVVGGS